MEILLGTRLNDLMAERELTGKQLAADTGITEGTISKILTGVNTNPKSDTIIAFAKYFNVSSDYLLGLSEYKTPQAADIGAITGLSDKNIQLLQRAQEAKKTLDKSIKQNEELKHHSIVIRNHWTKVMNQIIQALIENSRIDKIAACRYYSENCMLTINSINNENWKDEKYMMPRIQSILSLYAYVNEELKEIDRQINIIIHDTVLHNNIENAYHKFIAEASKHYFYFYFYDEQDSAENKEGDT